MKKIGMTNRQIDSALNRQGHGDLFIICDAGFACPDHVEVIDIAVSHGKPSVLEVLKEIREAHHVEKILIAEETKKHNPSYFKEATTFFGEDLTVEVISHEDLKKLSHDVKTIIRTGDFTAWANVILVSGAGDDWQLEITDS